MNKNNNKKRIFKRETQIIGPKKIEIKTFFKKQAKIYDGFCSVK